VVADVELGEMKLISVLGGSSHPNINAFEAEILSNESESRVIVKGIDGTISHRTHPSPDTPNPMIEINLTMLGCELFTVENQGLPYGSNPRLPVLCPTFTDIYNTVTAEDRAYLNFIAFNTGVDIFASKVEVEGNDVNITFDGPRDGIANGGLTYSVLQYAASQNLLPEDLRVSVRIWSRQEQSPNEQTTVADKRNSHRPLEDIDKLNQMGAFEKMKEVLDEAFVERIVWHTGDQQVDQDGNIPVILFCRALYAFKIKAGGTSNERHPTMNPKSAGGIESVYEKIEVKGAITNPKFGSGLMAEAIGDDV